MLYKHGEFKIPHFAHKSDECKSTYSEPETLEHIQGKKNLYEWLNNQEGINNLQLEAWIPETKQRPDIYFEHDNKKYVIEYQCSPISTNYAERRRLYELAGIKDIWILGTEKYDIGNWKSTNQIDVSNLNLFDIKTKTLERELLDVNKKIIYLRNNTLYKTKSVLDIGLKTKFNITYDINSRLCANFKDLINNSGLNINSPKFNNVENQIYNICKKLNKNAEYLNSYFNINYTKEVVVTQNSIMFKILKNDNVILNYTYENISTEIIDNLFNQEMKFISDLTMKIGNFATELEYQIYTFNQQFSNKGKLELSKYNGELQIKSYINFTNRVFTIDVANLKVICKQWQSFRYFSGMSRKGNKKYENAWSLKYIESFGFSTDMCATEIIDIIKFYYSDVDFSNDFKENSEFQIKCCDCKNDFNISLGEFKFYKSKNFELPKRCNKCRKARKKNID